MQKIIYLKPEIEEIVLPYQPLLAGSFEKIYGDVDDFNELLSRDLDDMLLNEYMGIQWEWD